MSYVLWHNLSYFTKLNERREMRTSMVVVVAAILSASVAFAAEAKLPNPLHDAKPGEWALFEIPGGYTQKQTIVSRQGSGPEAEIKIRIDNIYNGEVVNSQEVTEVAGEESFELPEPESDVVLSVTEETIALKGKDVPVTVITATESDGSATSWYISPVVPVYGLVKQVADDEVEINLVDFGE